MCQLCSESNEKMEPTDNELLGPNTIEHVGSSTSGAVSPEEGTMKQDVSSPLTSLNSFASNCSDYSVDVNPSDGYNPEEGGSESSQDDPGYRMPDGYLRNSGSVTSMNALLQSDDLKENQKEGHSESDDGSTTSDEGSDEENELPPMFDDKAEIWVPPPAENEEDNIANNMATLVEDDDECADSDGGEWAKPSSLEFDRLKEDKQKAMEEVMNGKFKKLVSQLLGKLGVENCEKTEQSWVDIVTPLAWQAASFVKPDTTEGKAMDPAGYVKIKCIAAGSPTESQLIKGLVFKKHAAHKHMPTKYKNPRLLLIEGMLGPSSGSSGLSSFNSMISQDKDNLADLIENLEACHPNVILVEKSASRDVLEEILKMGVTLVLDMKRNRLERVACCTGSPILSSDKAFNQKLKHCDSLYFERFVEEHAIVGEAGKKPVKTLMFLEGCPTRLGCTILLKGSHSEELKKIKCVVQCAVVMAYHFILETSFLVDQKAMFSTIAFGRAVDISATDEESSSAASETPNAPDVVNPNANVALPDGSAGPTSNGSDEGSSNLQESTAESASSSVIDVPISNGFHEETSPKAVEAATSNGFHEEGSSNMVDNDVCTVCHKPHMKTLSAASPSICDALEKVSMASPDTFKNVSTYIDLDEAQTPAAIPIAPAEEEAKSSCKEDEAIHNDDSSLSLSAVDARNAVDDSEECIRPKDEISSVLDAESILVLMSSRNASRGTICEQSHFSHIKFYRNFDVPLGKFLRDSLFNQNLQCKTCNELPEAHFYYYAHHNKQLTIRVKRLPDKGELPGESEGKLWMWSRCGKCEPDKERATKRVLISTVARGLSFGKFLELSFSSHSSFNRLSRCGHSFQKDFLYFFGLGSKVAMFRYSRVTTYTVSVPAQKLEFNGSINKDWLKNEIESVYTKGLLLFTEISNYLKKIESRFSGSNLVLNGSLKAFTDIVDMLKLERSEFEENIKNIGYKHENSQESVHKLLSLNQLRWDILLEACIWDRRLQMLLSSSSNFPRTISNGEAVQKQIDLKEVDGTQAAAEEVAAEKIVEVEDSGHLDAKIEGKESKSDGDHDTSESSNGVDVHVETVTELPSEELESLPKTEENIQRTASQDSIPSVVLSQESLVSTNLPTQLDSNIETHHTDNTGHMSEDRNIPIIEAREDNGSSSSADNVASERPPAFPPSSVSDDSKGWVWNPFSQIREECMKDLQKGFVPKFGHLPKLELLHSPDVLGEVVSQVIIEEGSRLHIPLRGGGDYIVSDYEGEISSSVACALALIKDLLPPTSDGDDNTSLKRAESAPTWPLGSLNDLDMLHSASSLSFSETRFSSFDGSNILDSLLQVHPEVHLGIEQFPIKGKYSVVCIYAKKFRALRNRCCPSEVDYIASLSRCKIWDAKGGKSKSFFAKTLDDRLIIKEIKKTEYESFMKFASEYFRHMKDSFDSGNQTCLAKVLGIYQVTIRHPRSGKETKHDLMVMENLSFGRNVTRQYDLKGALHARFTATADGPADVLLDQNFVNDMNSSPLYVGQRAKRLLQRAVWNDTTFLNTINVMDYSLLVGVDRKRRELICGIIDYLRQYTWDKQFETWVKSSLVVPKNVLPTVISPQGYKKRFRKFMDTHFLTVPDHWCSQRSSNPCRLCGIKPNADDSFSSHQVKSTEKHEEGPNGFHVVQD